MKNDPDMRTEFVKEMQRFLPSKVVAETAGKTEYWEYLTQLVQEEVARAVAAVESSSAGNT